MLPVIVFITICASIILIITKKMSVITALILIPLLMGVIAGFSPKELGDMILAGIKQVAPTGIMLLFAILFFAVMLDAGLFDPIIRIILKQVKGDPLKVIVGTALLTMIVHLDGDGTATFMIVISAFLPIYKKLGINRLILSGIVALGVGPLHLVPWSGTSARAISSLKTDSIHLFNPNIPSIIAGACWVLLVAFIFGIKERKRLGIHPIQFLQENSLTEEQVAFRRPKLFWVNATLTLALLFFLIKGGIAAPSLFAIAAAIALLINYPILSDQQKIIKNHGGNIFTVTSLIFAAGIFSGILNGTKMIDSMVISMVHLIPKEHANLLPVLTALTSMPASLIFTPDTYYFGALPIIAQTAQQFGIDPLEIGRAALMGQMTVGFPISALTGSTFLLIGLSEVELGEHQKFIFKWAWGTSIVMILMALLTGSLHV